MRRPSAAVALGVRPRRAAVVAATLAARRRRAFAGVRPGRGGDVGTLPFARPPR